MLKLISSVQGTLPHTEKEISITADSKNIIVTGMNGCGKTVFLNAVLNAINFSVEPNKISEKNNLLRNIDIYENAIKSANGSRDQIDNFKQELKRSKIQLEDLFKSDHIAIKWNDHDAVLEKSYNRNLLVSFFEATRQYSNVNRNHHNGLSSLSEIRRNGQNQQLNQDFSTSFESYLVAFFEAGYMASMMRGDPSEKQKVDSWLESISGDLSYLFEDQSLTLQYNEQERRFYIEQDGKNPYTFSTLSSGYSSILKIYTDLLMKVELHEMSPKELTGIVIIDEIDAHLHVSLQKKILSFLDHSYPNVQFIVSTHSPFVLQSVDNAVIYDLSKLEQLEDLSLYSYDAIVKGLLGVSTNSDDLTQITSELSSLIPDIEENQVRVNELIAKLAPVEGELDSKSKVLLLMAKQALEDLEG
ncbi:AAA family ATPase [Vibrio cholerae]|uniref:AAA family ATPase n=1 Tax=Vibrio cholerae TaxID=666 RepID=UPI0029341BA3|nr:AAA family ATPase [Vibrio cholerae]MDV2314611.1 AAA family ATPase [Vibrio cholerae]